MITFREIAMKFDSDKSSEPVLQYNGGMDGGMDGWMDGWIVDG